jgi:hypothetical protein
MWAPLLVTRKQVSTIILLAVVFPDAVEQLLKWLFVFLRVLLLGFS